MAKKRSVREEYMQKLQLYRDQFQRGSRYIRKSTNIKSILESARQLWYDENVSKLMDANKDLVGCHSGVVDLRTQELRRDPHDYVSKRVDANFQGIDHPSPDIDAFFSSVFDHDAEVIRYMQKLFGYSLTGHIREQKMIVCHGVGSNGKGIMVEMMQRVFGDYGLAMDKDCVIKGKRPQSEGAASSHIAALKGKRLATCEETEEDCVLNEENVKVATGNAIITCRELYSKQMQFEPTHQIVLITNHRPKFNSDGEAMKRRMVLVPFDMQYKEVSDFDANNPSHRLKDLELASKLAEPEARDQLFAWLLRGVRMWYEEHLGEPPAKLKEATKQYIEENDSIGNFIREYCEKGSGYYISTTEFKTAFEAATETTISAQKLAEKMKNKGYVVEQMRTEDGRHRLFKKIRLSPA